MDGLDLCVHEGDVYGFLGPNGAGKTTAIRCMLGLIRRDAGEVSIFGEQGRGALRHVGAIVETPAFHGRMSGFDNLWIATAYAGMPARRARDEIARVLQRVGLSERARDRVEGFSLGMRQRLGIARALLGSPRLLVLDEPTHGLDPRGMRELRDLVRSLALHDGITVLLSSHLLSEVQSTCNRVGIIQEGRLRAEGRVDELLAAGALQGVEVEVGSRDPDRLRATVEAMPEVAILGPGRQGRLRLRLRGLAPDALNRRLVEAGLPIDALVPHDRDLEDVFLEVTG